MGVVAFPLYRRGKLVTGIAGVLRAIHGEEANVFWRETAKTLAQQLVAAGVEYGAARDEIRTLLRVVLAELQTGMSARADR
ncbi:DUF6074 family protein [Mesorhizobium sp. WSM2239]|uniref:DUF6074 family protein n=2 Tax=unclassified Mesorhizobium TaxID=325217 RepID=A0AAU8DI17_9HYPH